MAETTDSRMWRCNRQQVQPFIEYEGDRVRVGPSRVHGLGVFAARDFSEGELVCWYGGKCVKCGTSSSRFMIEVDCFNFSTNTLEKWHLDAENPDNACGRWVNDSVGTQWEGIYNVKWVPRLSKKPDLVYMTYTVDIVALTDIKKGEELLMSYGAAYWSSFRNYKGLDPNIPTGDRYKQIMRYLNR